jgi:hypothetical protein
MAAPAKAGSYGESRETKAIAQSLPHEMLKRGGGGIP